MDITLLFRGCVKTIKTKNLAFGDAGGEIDRSRILQGRPSKREFTLKSKEIIQHITRLYEFLIEHQQAYLNFSNHLAGRPHMTNSERDKIDAGAKRIISACSNFLKDLESELSIKPVKQSQAIEHERVVVTLLKEYLKHVCKIYTEQRTVRIQRSGEFKRRWKMDLLSSKNEGLSNQENYNQSDKVLDCGVESMKLSSQSLLEDESLSPEELQMFELENNELFNELNSLTDEVRQIETKVVKITELQELFSEKVLQQDKNMNHVAAMVAGTTENVKDANDQIRQAIQRNAGLRVWILFFLLVMSFSLLFLDWYND